MHYLIILLKTWLKINEDIEETSTGKYLAEK